MKRMLFFLAVLASLAAAAQRSGGLSANGGRFVGFNIDGDTRTGYTKIFPASTPFFHDDDWFKPQGYAGAGKGIIDVSDSANLRARLQAGQNFSFTRRMIGQPYDIGVYFPTGSPAGGYAPQFLVDGVYFRDFYANDSSAFTSANKNGQNPNVWTGGHTNTGGKTDIIDVYTHVRTSGINPTTDSVWFFAGVSTKNVVGERYFDIEVYREPIYYNRSANGSGVNFVSLGTSYGHSKWELNSTGRVIRTGDIIISVAYKSGLAPEIDFRIWLAKSTYDSIQNGRLVPATFKLNGRWDVADDGLHGYAEITTDDPGEIWGTGLGNFSGSASADSTYATPWGTINTGGNWSPHYDQLQFVEIGLNFSRFGMNPFQYVTSFCKSPYAAIMVKSRSSTSFSANLDDFVGPVPFTVKEAAPFTVSAPDLTCVRTGSNILWNYSARNYYRLIGPNGDTLAKDVDFRTVTDPANRFITVTQPGVYRVEATNFQGCPTLSVQTIEVRKDTIPPTARVSLGWNPPNYFLRGGDTAASNALTPFGRSAGLTFDWTGPGGFTATGQNASLDSHKVAGTYYLDLTEARNGCRARDSILLDMNNFTLAATAVFLQLRQEQGRAALSWQAADKTAALWFVVERSADGLRFYSIAQQPNTRQESYDFIDRLPLAKAFYRIKAVYPGGGVSYSATVSASGSNAQAAVFFFRDYASNRLALHSNATLASDTWITVVDLNGRRLLQQACASGWQGRLTLPLPAAVQGQPVLVLVTAGKQLVSARKL